MKLLICTLALLGSSMIITNVGAQGMHPEPLVRTDSGSVLGSRVSDSRVMAFKGIPYAKPPVGALRWKPPQPVLPWHGVRNAKKFGDSCMQATPGERLPWTPVFMTHTHVSEDCLYLNVWTPHLNPNARLPVIVFIHGGGFVEGAGSVRIYNGAKLASNGVVIVTINYRLGIFGFFANKALARESKHHAAGNYGFLDQIAALRWVKKNIANFGGNPHNVTIWGQSAGAMSVEALVLSPRAIGLFEHAQADSGIGVAVGLERSLADAERSGDKFARSIGAHSLSALRAVPATKLMHEAQDYARKKHRMLVYSPDVDGWVLPASLRKLTREGSGSDVPLIIGWNANDWMLFQRPVTSVDQYQQLAHRFYGSMYARFLKLYPVATVAQAKAMQALSSQDRDCVQTWLWATRRRQSGKVHSDVYLYSFKRAIPWPQHSNFGAFHSSELPYFFRNLSFMPRPWQSVDHALSKRMSDYLMHFAATGNPNASGLPNWQPLVASKRALSFGDHVRSMPLCSSKLRCIFWRKYFKSRNGRHAPAF